MRRKPHGQEPNGESEHPKDGHYEEPFPQNKRSTRIGGQKYRQKPMIRNEDPAWSQPNYQSEGYDAWTKALGEMAEYEAETRRVEAEAKKLYLQAEAELLRSTSPGKVGSIVQAASQVIGVAFILLILLVLLV